MSLEIRRGGARVLVVEDDPGDVDLVRDHLSRVSAGELTLDEAGTLSEALGLLEEESFDVVLLDLGLPDSTGLETLDAVLDTTPDVPVIVLTGMTGEGVGLAAVRRDAADFLPKDELTGRLLVRSVRYARERRRRRMEVRFRSLIENSRDLVAVLDPDLSVRYVSPSSSRILGLEPEERIGASALEEVHPDDRERVVRLERRLEDLVELVPQGWLYPEVTEARIRYADRAFRTGGFAETPWRLSEDIVCRGEVVGRLEVALTEEPPERDDGPFLTEERELLEALALAVGEAVERERLEKEFIQAQKMEAVGRLSGGIAHDFNNLLTVIRAHTDFLLMDLAASGPLADEARAILDAANRAAELTNQLLAFSREQVLRPRVLHLNEIVDSEAAARPDLEPGR